MNINIWTGVLCLLLGRHADCLEDDGFSGSQKEVEFNTSAYLNYTKQYNYNYNYTATPKEPNEENSEFPPSIFTKDQLKHGAVILYFIGAIYSFCIIGIVCGDYFLPSVDCICTDLNLSQDVAAATFMSFATTAPELFIILITTFIKESDIGVGAVVGSGMFNILGVATVGGLAAKMPIKLDWWPLYRDSLVYMFAPIALAVVVYDGFVTLTESLCLILYYFFYFIIMFFNRSIRARVKTWVKELSKRKNPKDETTVSATSEKTPQQIVPDISLTVDHKNNDEVMNFQGVKEDAKDFDDGSFKAYFMNYDDSISLRRISACSNASSRSNRSRRKSDRSLRKTSQTKTTTSSQSRLGDNLQFVSSKLAEPLDGICAETKNGLVEDVVIVSKENDEPEQEPVRFCTLPDGSPWEKFTWLVLWPFFFLLHHTIPDSRSKKWRRFYPITFLMCVFWIGVSSYFGTWMISVVGNVIGITESVMGLTFLALGGSMPEAISTFIMSRQGEGGVGFSNSLGGNTMDICLCLGVPWLIKSAMQGPIEIESHYLHYNSAALVLGVIVLLSISTHTKFHMNKRMGLVCCTFYFAFIIVSILIEMRVFSMYFDR